MNDNIGTFAATLICGIILGFASATVIAISDYKEFMIPFDAAMAKCEYSLPRNKSCTLVYEAKVKE